MKEIINNDGIDFVIVWVDGNDSEWEKDKMRYSDVGSLPFNVDSAACRYRDWDNLQYLFRGIEKFAPWVRRVHFVTCGHVPAWLNLDYEKLNIVKHEDYIPSQYLPTFSSHPIELNLHRIKDLSKKFVYFNDDMFITKPMAESDFFKNDLPCDAATLYYIKTSTVAHDLFPHIILNVISIINKNFNVNEMIRKNPLKWFNRSYGVKFNINNLLLLPYGTLGGLLFSHTPSPFLKDTFEDVWDSEYEVLNQTSSHKFRDISDVNQYLMKAWQLLSGNFYPKNIEKISKIFSDLEKQKHQISDAIRYQKCSMICINDSGVINDFEEVKQAIIDSFDAILPDKSRFEL